MYIHNLDPTILNLGPLEIRWYGLVYVLGFLLGAYFLQRKQFLSKDAAWDLIFYIMVGIIVGARLFEFLWAPSYYFSNPLNIFKIWQGGMSFHGGLIGSILGTYVYTKKKSLNFWKIADILAVPAIFALALGRIANFINGELVGRPYDGKFCVIFPNYQECRHPSTLYAAFKRFAVFGWVLFLTLTKTFKPGFIFWNFVFFEGLGRFIIDFYRENSLFLQLSLGQWLSLIMIIISACIFLKYYQEDWKKIL
jgi:phosphatidylglycerol---prolipoprotein diacylglyceryl transferase